MLRELTTDRPMLAGKILRRLCKAPLRAYLWGLLMRTQLTRAGLVTVMPGWPKPKVTNRGGEIHVANCTFYPGVRLEVLAGGRIEIGNGTYLNRGTPR